MSAEIDELVLRIPGLDAETARRVAEEVARRLAGGLRSVGPLPIPAGASLRITLPSAQVPDLAAEIAARILEALS
ncbi:MAG TPA: hypothetical protein VGD37_05550 [Kofleriaceae bacterium]